MKVLVSQGITAYSINPVIVERILTEIYGPTAKKPMSKLISTGLSGVDASARTWATARGIPIETHPVNNPNDFGGTLNTVAFCKAVNEGEPEQICRFHVSREWFNVTSPGHHTDLTDYIIPTRRFLITDEWVTLI